MKKILCQVNAIIHAMHALNTNADTIRSQLATAMQNLFKPVQHPVEATEGTRRCDKNRSDNYVGFPKKEQIYLEVN